MVLVEARVVDSTHLELAKPIAARRGRTVFVSIAESVEKDADRQQWLAVAAAALQAAYGESEPDYSPVMVKESNPDYGARWPGEAHVSAVGAGPRESVR